MNRIGVWNSSGNSARSIRKYVENEHSHRIGRCAFLPSDGDLCVCIAPAGDFFDNYIAIREENGRFKKAGKFGAYGFGVSIGDLPEREFHLLMAGEPVKLELDKAND